MTTFDAETLRPIGNEEPDLGHVAAMVMQYAEPVNIGPARGRWKLREDVRRQVLATLGARQELAAALQANLHDRSGDPAQRALADMMVDHTDPKLSERSLEELLGIDRAVEWLEAAGIASKPSRAEVRAQIQREKLLEPLRRLTVGFEGRDDELRKLREYVDVLPSQSLFEGVTRGIGRAGRILFGERPPLVIYGPGGAGKSTLVAQFILQHASRTAQQPIAFVLLDFDRSTLDPTRPDALMADITRQLGVQFPQYEKELARLEGQLQVRLGSEDAVQTDRSAHYDVSTRGRSELIELMNEIANRTRRNLLFVVDTFEIVQRRGSSAVYSLLDFINQLVSGVRRLRVVLVGRAMVDRREFGFAQGQDQPAWEELPLKGFDAGAGRAYLEANLRKYQLGPVTPADLDRVVLQVRGNPLGLRLAAQVFAREGVFGVEDTIGRQRQAEEINDEMVQGLLHARIVEHLDNEDLKRIANPGLVVRRITPDVISKVLAGPCGLNLEITSADTLFWALQQEVSLVEPADDAPMTVRHRQDVRLIMLPALRRDLGSQAQDIDTAAVEFWQAEPGPAARAEEIYHRLWRRDSEAELNASWSPAASQPLEGVLDEFQTVAPGDWYRIWLYQKMDRELPDTLRRQADQLAWEQDTERKARTLVSDGKTEEALRLLHERPLEARVPTSQLWLIEIDTRLLRGEVGIVSELISVALKQMGDTIDGAYTLALLSRRVALEERLNALESARGSATEALALARSLRDRASIFAFGVTLCRLARKTGHEMDPEIVALRLELAAESTTDAVQRALIDRPSLLREAAAEIGAQAPTLIADALDRLGFQTASGGVPDEVQYLARNIRDGRMPDQQTLSRVAEFYAGSVDRLINQVL